MDDPKDVRKLIRFSLLLQAKVEINNLLQVGDIHSG
jgi:hypothetical protein